MNHNRQRFHFASRAPAKGEDGVTAGTNTVRLRSIMTTEPGAFLGIRELLHRLHVMRHTGESL